jgi:hypothetical protein
MSVVICITRGTHTSQRRWAAGQSGDKLTPPDEGEGEKEKRKKSKSKKKKAKNVGEREKRSGMGRDF